MSGPIVSSRSAWFAVAVFTIANTLSFVDRLLPSILVDPIRRTLLLSDTEMGVIHGLPFALFYATVGLWLGRHADRSDRARLAAVGIAVWSLATVASAFATGFWTLFGARVFVAIGEAALAPAAYSLISGLFAAERLGRAMSIYQIGIYVGSGMALIFGGSVASMALGPDAWRAAFVIAGLPGIAVAIAAWFVPEPRRGAAQRPSTRLAKPIAGLGRAAYIFHFAAFSFVGVAAYGATSWLPSVLIRGHGYSLLEAGLSLGLILAFVSPLGVLCAGWLVDRAVRAGNYSAIMTIGAAGVALLAPTALVYGTAQSPTTALIAAVPFAFLLSYPFGIAPVALQLMTPAGERGRMTALYLFVFTIFGYAIGPVAVGWITDHVFAAPAMVGRSLALVVGTAALAAAGLMVAGRVRIGQQIAAILESRS